MFLVEPSLESFDSVALSPFKTQKQQIKEQTYPNKYPFHALLLQRKV